MLLKKLFQNTLCKLGVHDWNYVHKWITRECKCCGKFQITINDEGFTGFARYDEDGNYEGTPHLPSTGDRWQTTVKGKFEKDLEVTN